MEGRERPGGVTIIAATCSLIGAAIIVAASFSFGFVVAPFAFVVGLAFLGISYGTWKGLSWAWYLLTFGGGVTVWYLASDEVKEFFGVGDGRNEEPYSGD